MAMSAPKFDHLVAPSTTFTYHFSIFPNANLSNLVASLSRPFTCVPSFSFPLPLSLTRLNSNRVSCQLCAEVPLLQHPPRLRKKRGNIASRHNSVVANSFQESLGWLNPSPKKNSKRILIGLVISGLSYKLNDTPTNPQDNFYQSRPSYTTWKSYIKTLSLPSFSLFL